jgi:signal transduction histidine kinase
MTRQGRQLAIALDETVWTVNPRNDTLLNLTGYISNHAQEFFRYSGIKCNLDVASDLPNMVVNAQIRHNLFLAVKEAFNNVAKHSGARQVRLRIHCAATALRISIEDNGRGFDLGAAGGGEGLTNMRERLQAAKGTAEFLSQIGQGTTVVFTLATANGRGGEPEASPQ